MYSNNAVEASYHGRSIKIHYDRTEDFTWSERYEKWLYDSDCVIDANGESILRDDSVHAVDGEYYHEDDVYYSDILDDYVPVGEEAVYSEYHKDYLYRPDAFFSEILNDWFVSEDELLKAERKHELEEVTA